MRLGKQPVVADGAAEAADRRVDDRKERLVVAGDVVRAGVDLVRDPRVHLAVLARDPVGPIRHVVLKTTPGQRGSASIIEPLWM